MSRLHPVFNVVKLMPAPSDPILGHHPPLPPPPEIINGEEEWIIEEILDSKMVNRKLWYLIKWEGFGIEHNSWEPWNDVHAPELIMEFYQKHPGAARQIRALDFRAIPFCSISPKVPSRHSLERGVDVRGLSEDTPSFPPLPPLPPLPPNPYLHYLPLFIFRLTVVK